MKLIPVIKKVFHSLGLEVLRFGPASVDTQLRKYLLTYYNIDRVIDIGANQGQFALELRREVGFQKQIISFEPLKNAFEVLNAYAQKDADWTAHQLALGETEEQIVMNVSQDQVSSSILRIKEEVAAQMARVQIIGSEQVMLTTLDAALLPYSSIPKNTYLKIDVQGYEMPVLRGAVETLRQASVVQVELSLDPFYQGNSNIEDVISYLRQHGFIPYSFMTGVKNSTTGQLYQVDGFFIRNLQ